MTVLLNSVARLIPFRMPRSFGFALVLAVSVVALQVVPVATVQAQSSKPSHSTKTGSSKSDAAKAEAAKKEAAKTETPAPSAAAVAATTPPSDGPIQVGELSAVPVPAIAARAWITMDVTSGQVVASSNADMKVEPASLTKIMTAYVAFNALDDKRLTLDQQANVSQAAWKTKGSRMFIEPRKPVTVDELMKGVIIQSGNDASVAIAEAVSGNETSFVALMNQEAKRLGMDNTNFQNATGLPDPQHMTTVRDLATLARRMIVDHAEYFPYYSTREFTYNKIKQTNRNRLLWADPSVDGMKTGHTDAAGYCLVATAKRGDRRVITVLVGSDSSAARAEESLKLLNWTFQNFETIKLFDKSHPAVEARVWQGQTDVAKLGVMEPLWVTVPRGKASDVKPVIKRPDPLLAPLTQGQKVGTLALMLDDKLLRTEPLEVLDPVERAGFFGRTIDMVKLWWR
jgi:D-alanyl-D-alanine carboxypeptidase (penicillin-binding protein 5/6)